MAENIASPGAEAYEITRVTEDMLDLIQMAEWRTFLEEQGEDPHDYVFVDLGDGPKPWHRSGLEDADEPDDDWLGEEEARNGS